MGAGEGLRRETYEGEEYGGGADVLRPLRPGRSDTGVLLKDPGVLLKDPGVL